MDMKKYQRKSRFACLVALAMAAVWAMTIVTPTPLPAQDIDDVMQGLDRDFSLGNNKEELKRSNLETANEQNREDVKITESENPFKLASTSTCIYSGTYTGNYTDMSGTTTITCSIGFSCDTSSPPIPLHFTGSCVDGQGISYLINGNLSMLPSFSLTVTELNSCSSPENTKTGSGSIIGTGGSGTSLSGSVPTTCDTGTTTFSITKS